MSHLPEFGDPIRAPIDPDEAWKISKQFINPKRMPLPEGSGVWVGDAPEDEPEAIDTAIRTMTALTAKIARILADNDVYPALCETVEYQIHQLWSNALKTVQHA